MRALAGQAAHVPRGTDLVTIEIGANDACGPPPTIPPSMFRAQLGRALSVLDARVPRARVVVVSIFDVLAMWDAVKTPPAASFARASVSPRQTATGLCSRGRSGT